MKFAVVLGSSRSDGNTSQLSQYISERLDAKLIELNQFIMPLASATISPYHVNFLLTL